MKSVSPGPARAQILPSSQGDYGLDRSLVLAGMRRHQMRGMARPHYVHLWLLRPVTPTKPVKVGEVIWTEHATRG